MKRRNAATLLALLVVTPACAGRRARTDTPTPFDFARLADSIVAAPPLHRAHLGIEVYDPATKRILYAWNSERHFVPASNQKLWVTSTALHELGPDWRYRTRVLAIGDDGNGTAHSLVVVGSGDPTMSARFHETDVAALEMLADSIMRGGVRRITGDVVIDASRFDRAIIPGTWTFGNLNGTSAPPTGAFVIAEGIFGVRVRPGANAGDPAIVEPLAPGGVVTVASTVVTSAPGAQGGNRSTSRGPWSDTLRISGRIAQGANPATSRLPMTDPVRFAAFSFADVLRARGIVIDGTVRIVQDSTEAGRLRRGEVSAGTTSLNVREVAAWTSPPMSDIVAAILGPSQNWIAEQVLRTLGAERRGIGSWNAGINIETNFLYDVVGIDSSAVRPSDASGMSNYNLVTPHAVVQLFDYARTAPWSSVFRKALAAPGKPGTLNNRLRELEGRLSGKTGTLNSVNALSGYVTTRDGRELIFSILSNASGLGASPVTGAADKLVRALANGFVPH